MVTLLTEGKCINILPFCCTHNKCKRSNGLWHWRKFDYPSIDDERIASDQWTILPLPKLCVVQ